jgi:hypothetical protein
MQSGEAAAVDEIASHEDGFVRAFVLDGKRERFRELLSKPKRRSKAQHRLADRRDMDERVMVAIRPDEQTTQGISTLLRQRGAPDRCYVISELAALDQRMVSLHEALSATVGMGLGSVLSCVPGQLAYFEGETPGDRCLLVRLGGRTRR